jgi:hypothetical protein
MQALLLMRVSRGVPGVSHRTSFSELRGLSRRHIVGSVFAVAMRHGLAGLVYGGERR